jgi:putative SOS response-associated peptidase YedK
MCGRYYIEIDEKELREIANEVEKNTRDYPGQMSFKTSGEIFPTDIVPVQTGVGEYQPMKWGFSGFDKKLVINAKSETALQKPMFQESMLERRCLIPASGYYEWKKAGSKKIKYQFFIPKTPMFLAGCWRQEKDSPFHTFVILTRPAVKTFEEIHDRMPVIIPQSQMRTWLYDSSDAMAVALTELSFEKVS